jgi:hypothetical protein
MATQYGRVLISNLQSSCGRQSAKNLFPSDQERAEALAASGADHFAEISENNGTVFLGAADNPIVQAYLEQMGYTP